MKTLFGFYAFCLLSIAACNNQNKNTSAETTSDIDTIRLSINKLTTEIRENPENDISFSDRANIYFMLGSLDSAINDIEIASKLNPDNDSYFLRRADMEILRGQAAMAQTAISRVLKRNPVHLEANMKMANLNLITGQYTAARNLADVIIRSEPDYAPAYYVRALISYYEEKYDETINDLMIVVTKDPQHYEAQNILGLIYSERGNDIAIDFFLNAIQLKPDLVEPRYNLGYYYQVSGREEEAIAQYNDILMQVDSTVLNPLFNIGYIYQEQQKYSLSNEVFEKAAIYHPQEARIFYRIGLNYEKIGDKQNALRMYEHCLELDPDLEEAFEAMRAL